MSGIYKCPCGQQFKAAVPAGGAQVKCPGCGKLLKLPGPGPPAAAPAQRPRQQQPFPASAPTGDSLFGDVDVPASPSPSFGAPLGTPSGAPAGGNPFPRKSSPASPASRAKQGKSGKALLIVGAGVGGLLVLFFIVGIIAALSGRDRAAGGPAAGRPAVGGPARGGTAAVARSTKPVTSDEAKVVAEKFERELKTGSPFVANQMVDWQGVVQKGLDGFDISESDKNQFAAGAVTGLRGRNWAQLIKTQTRGRIKLLRTRTTDGAPTALFRTNTIDGGIGYFEFAFYRDANEKVAVSDVYMFHTGEWMSETMHRAAIPFIAEHNKSFLQKLSGKQSDYVKHHKDIETMGRMVHISPQAAMGTYKKLPATLKGDKTVMVLRIGIASKMNDENEYQAAINDFMQKFPNDPAAQLFAIDYYALKNDLNGALTAIKKLDQQVGGDPALQVIEATVHMQQGNLPRAKSLLQEAIEQEPDNQEAKTMLASLP